MVVSTWAAKTKFHRPTYTTDVSSDCSGFWKVQNEDSGRFSSWRALFLACRQLPSYYVLTWHRKREWALISLLIRTLIPSWGIPSWSPHLNWTTSLWPTPSASILAVEFSTYKFEGNKTSIHNNGQMYFYYEILKIEHCTITQLVF